jgi:hypothetical protein
MGVIGGLDCSTDPTTLVRQCPGVETWLHGDIQPQITTTWLAMAGPGVEHRGIDNSVWSDHTDARPTLLAALGLRDRYVHDGRVLTEILDNRVSRSDGEETLAELQRVFKQINAPVGRLALTTLQAATGAIESGTATDDRRYRRVDQQILSIARERNELAARIEAILEGVAFDGRPVDRERAAALIAEARALLERADGLGSGEDSDSVAGQDG